MFIVPLLSSVLLCSFVCACMCVFIDTIELRVKWVCSVTFGKGCYIPIRWCFFIYTLFHDITSQLTPFKRWVVICEKQTGGYRCVCVCMYVWCIELCKMIISMLWSKLLIVYAHSNLIFFIDGISSWK